LKGVIDLTISDEHRLKLEKIQMLKERDVLEERISRLEKLQNIVGTYTDDK
jgi:hypothetical protein